MKLKYLFYSMFMLSTSLLFSCANVNDMYHHVFTSVGYAPIAIQNGKSFDEKMLNAIKASKLEAYKELTEQIYGVLLTATNDVKSAQLIDDRIQSRVRGIVRGAKVLKSYHEGDLYITELELNMQSLPFLRAREFNQSTSVIVVNPQIYY